MKFSTHVISLLTPALLGIANAQIIYQDTFDDGDVSTNVNGVGGGLTLYNRQGSAMQETGGNLVPTRVNGNDRGNAVSTNSFSLVGGFQMTVEFTVSTGPSTGGSANRGFIGLTAADNVLLASQTNSTYHQNQLATISSNYVGAALVVDDVLAAVDPGFYHSNGTAADRAVDTSQVIPVGTLATAILIVNSDNTYSYQVDGAAPSMGTLPSDFNFGKNYHFFFYDQDTEVSTTLHSVTVEKFVTSGLNIPQIAASDLLIESNEPVTFNITFDNSAETAFLDIPGDADIDLLALDASDAIPNDGLVEVTDMPAATHNYQVLLTKTDVPDASAGIEINVVDPAAEAADNAFSTAIEADLPLFYYRFEEEVDATVLRDSSGNGNHTVDLQLVTLGAGPGGMQNALSSGPNTSVLAPATSAMNQTFTFAAMINLNDFTATTTRREILSMNDGTGLGVPILAYNVNGFVTLLGGAVTVLADGSSYNAGESCLVHFVYDADPDDDVNTVGGEVRLYVNGSQVGISTPITATSNVGNWVIASGKNRFGFNTIGWVDETALFESELTDAQIEAHAAAFFDAADPFLAFHADNTELNFGEPVTLTWKVSDAATEVTINGEPAEGTATGGVFTATFTPTADTTYTIDVTGPGGPFTDSLDVTVTGAPPVEPAITAIRLDEMTPPNVTLEISGEPGVRYFIYGSADLEDGFPVEFADEVPLDAAGNGSISFEAVSGFRFFRVETER